MKTVKNLILIMVVFTLNTVVLKAQCGGSSSSSDSTKVKVGNQSFKVEGKCEMCQDKIEKAALSVKGVKTASWDVESHLLTLNTSDDTKMDDVYKSIANAGYDNEKVKSSDKAYKALPGCCQYRN